MITINITIVLRDAPKYLYSKNRAEKIRITLVSQNNLPDERIVRKKPAKISPPSNGYSKRIELFRVIIFERANKKQILAGIKSNKNLNALF